MKFLVEVFAGDIVVRSSGGPRSLALTKVSSTIPETLASDVDVAFLQSSRNFHTCYLLTDEHVARFVNVSNETQLLQAFQRDVDRCPEENSHYYEFNCYVGVVEDYLQKIDSYVHLPNNSFEYNMYYQLVLSRYRQQAICTGNELRTLMERVGELIDGLAQC